VELREDWESCVPSHSAAEEAGTRGPASEETDATCHRYLLNCDIKPIT